MTTRDRLVLMGVVVLGIIAAGWMLGVSPEREKASKLEAEVGTAQAALSSAQQQLSEAQGAQTQYTTAYASIVRLGKAVPASEEVPALVYELDQASSQKSVEFNSIASAANGAGASGSSSSPSTTTATAGFTEMPFTFVFNGTFVDLYHLLSQIQGFTVQGAGGAVQVSGRLLTIQSASLEVPNGGSSEGAKSASTKPENAELKGTITATAYVLPPGQGLTGGATAAGPVASPAGSAQPASSSGSTSGPSATHPQSAPAAVVRVTP